MALNAKRVKNAADRALENEEKKLSASNFTTLTTQTLSKKVTTENVVEAAEEKGDDLPVLQPVSVPEPPKPNVKVKEGKIDRGFGLNADGTFRQSNAGRKAKPANQIKQQAMLTLDPECFNALKAALPEGKKLSGCLSKYIEDHKKEVIKYIRNCE